MKKISIFLMTLCLACFGVAKAQTLTVADGTATNQYIPVYGYYADTDGCNSEFIIPAESLAEMTGKAITAMEFYVSSAASEAWTATFQVYLGEIRETTLSENYGPADFDVVYTGTLDGTGTTMLIEFDNPYTYNGGNLLVGTYIATGGNWKSAQFYGIEAEGAAYYSYEGYSGMTGGVQNFIPKTTFTYERPSNCYKPKNLAATLTPGDGTIATLTWERNDNGTEDAWVLQYGTDETFAAGSYTEVEINVNPIADLTGLTAETTYYARVKPDCDTEGTKWTNPISFTPTSAFAITVNDGTTTNGYVPIYGYYVDGSIVSQFIIPASDLAAIQWGTINEMTFYANEASINWGDATFEVYMTEVDYTTFSSTNLVEWNTMDKVMNAGSLGVTDNQMVITLDAPYQYLGGNLLIGFKQITSGSWVRSNWIGVTATGASLGGNQNGNQQNFLPKTTFSYIPGEEPTCFKPTNLNATIVGTETATLDWDGTSDSYVLQYRTAAHDNMNLWEQVGNDIIGTATLTQYTFDLSSYSGNGNIAIRHYNVSDMFRVAIDDIVVTNANGEEVVNEGFEDAFPEEWGIVDYDGDGYYWARVNFSSTDIQHGSYCVSSESWNQNIGALTPDNWLIIPDVELGGTLTFYMRGVDASFPQENIGVFVTTESLETVFATTPVGDWSADITTTETSYELTGLTANTEYEWQVKGVCGDTETGWATSSFTTIAEGFKTFITEGNWNVADNWFPAGVPTIEDEVSIEAAATIPAGVVATAKRVDLNGGSILIKDGGQLKQGAATLRVTMEKEITGYGESDGNYYFISSPFSGRTLYQASGTWSRVDNLFNGEYDFYAFDATAEDGLEWINYKANPSHISFESDNGNAGLMYGEGYLYGNQEGTTLQFVGTTGKSIDYSETMEYTFNGESTDEWNGWALVGNFFTCNAYINYIDADGNVLPTDFYTLNNDNTYTLSESNVGLAPCTGAFINYSTTGKVQYATEAPAKRTGMINMNLSRGNNTVDQARVRFGQGHNLQHMSFRNSSKLYMPVENNDYAVVYTENQGEMPVNFKAEENGNYTISFNTENVEFGYLHLIDNMTGADVDLLSTPSYSFEARTTDYASRFKLVFATGNADDSFAFFSNGNFVINNEGMATVQVIDINGRIMSSETINGCANVNVNAAAGVYMIRLINGESVKVQKVVVR